MKILEKDISLSVKNCLKAWQTMGVVLWWERLNSGKMATPTGGYVQLCQPGTSDYVAAVRSKNGNLILLFIEIKTPEGKLSPDQLAFAARFEDVSDIMYLKVVSRGQLDSVLGLIGIDKMKEMPEDL